jgi:phosphate acetyltransferase
MWINPYTPHETLCLAPRVPFWLFFVHEDCLSQFIEQLRKKCQAKPGRIGFPDSEDPRIWAVTERLLDEQSVREVTLFTKKADTVASAHQYGIDLTRHGDKVRFVSEAGGRVARLNAAAELLQQGKLDAVIAGNVSTTAEVIRAGISGVGLAQGVRTVSGSFIMHRPISGTPTETEIDQSSRNLGFGGCPQNGERTYLYADCGVVIAPTVRQLGDIAAESVKTWRRLFPDVEPVVAFLSFSTKGSAQHETQAKIAEATALFKAQYPNVVADGELQFDAAFDEAIGRKKAPDSPVPGRANCFIFPDLGAGNIAYKITQRLAGFEAYGPILQGLGKPFSDLSRGSTEADIVASCYVNLLRS